MLGAFVFVVIVLTGLGWFFWKAWQATLKVPLPGRNESSKVRTANADLQADVSQEIARLRRMGAQARDGKSVKPSTSVGSTTTHNPRVKAFDDDYGPILTVAPPGHILEFEYCDRDGVITGRRLTDWLEGKEYIDGWCDDRRAYRTFRRDRIIEWVEGEDALSSDSRQRTRV